MATERKTTEKRNIAPVTLTVEITATRINENGTLSGITTKVIKQSLPKDNTLFVVAPTQAGGGMYAKVSNDAGLSYLTVTEAGKAKAKVKLF